MYIFLCEDSIDGILTGVYDAWASHYGHKNIQLSCADSGDSVLFYEYIQVQTDFEKSHRVSDTLIRRFGMPFYEQICLAAMADGSCRKLTMDKANAIYQTIVMALALPQSAGVLQFLGEPCISCLFELQRQTSNEGHHLIEFLRFTELSNGVLFAQIHPKNYVLPMLADHFSNRLPLENFMIYDATHRLAVIHRASSDYLTVDASPLDLSRIREVSEQEAHWQQLWKTFFDTIAIDARKNQKLQSQNIPKRFWADTIELAENAAGLSDSCKIKTYSATQNSFPAAGR